MTVVQVQCSHCHGSGRFQGRYGGPDWPDCKACKGKGILYEIKPEPVTQGSNPESRADEVKRLLAEIAERQTRLAEIVLGDPREVVSAPVQTGWGNGPLGKGLT